MSSIDQLMHVWWFGSGAISLMLQLTLILKYSFLHFQWNKIPLTPFHFDELMQVVNARTGLKVWKARSSQYFVFLRVSWFGSGAISYIMHLTSSRRGFIIVENPDVCETLKTIMFSIHALACIRFFPFLICHYTFNIPDVYCVAKTRFL